MWIMLSDSFLSIVSKDCRPNELLVRARRKGDIEKLFPSAKVVRVEHADYLFRAVVERAEVMNAIDGEIRGIDYPNFKDSVRDDALHNAYLRVWAAMAVLQPKRPGFQRDIGSLFLDDPPAPKKKRKRRRRAPRYSPASCMDLE